MIEYKYQPANQPEFEYNQQPASNCTNRLKKLILTMLLILPLLFLLTMLILFIIFLVKQSKQSSYQTIFNSVSVTQQLKQDLSLPLFKSLTSTSQNTNCVIGQNELLLGQFPGVEKGCMCKEGNDWIKQNNIDQCSAINCKKGTGIDPSNYKTLYNEKKICYTELPTSDFIYGTRAECIAHARFNVYCKSGVCVENANNCPINGLALSQSSIGTQSVLLQENTAYLDYLRTMEARPIVKLELAYSPYCLDFISFPKLKSSTNYPLLGLEYTDCDQYQGYEQSGDSSEINLKQNNNQIIELKYLTTLSFNSITINDNTAPYYKDYVEKYKDKDQWKLFSIQRPNVGNDQVCSINKGFDNLKHVSTASSHVLKPLFIFTIIGLILSGAGLLVWLGLLGLSYTATSHKRKQSTTQFLKLSHIISILISLFIIFIFIHYMNTLSEEKQYLQQGQQGFNSALKLNCYQNTKGFQGAVNVVSSFTNFILDTAYPFIITFFILALIYLVFFSILSLICLINGESPFLPPYTKYYDE